MMEENTTDSELYDLCIQYKGHVDRAAHSDIISEQELALLDAAANDIRQWMNLHKHEEARFKAAACYSTINGTGLHIILEDSLVPVDLVDTWMKYSPETALVRDAIEMLPLHCLCYEPSLELVQILVNACPESVQIPMDDGMLPLHIACGGRTYHVCDLNLEVLNFLIETFPASLDVKTNDNMSVVDILQRWSRRICGYDTDDSEGEGDDDDDMNSLDQENNTYVESLLLHAVGGNLSINLIKLLLQAFPTSAVATGPNGRTALHFACSTFQGDNINLIALLIDFCPEAAGIADRHGKTPVQFFEAVASRRDERGMCLLHRLAAWSKGFSVSFLAFLITTYPDCMELPDNYGVIPYQYAFQNKELSIEVLMYFVKMSPEILCMTRYENLNNKIDKLPGNEGENGLPLGISEDLKDDWPSKRKEAYHKTACHAARTTTNTSQFGGGGSGIIFGSNASSTTASSFGAASTNTFGAAPAVASTYLFGAPSVFESRTTSSSSSPPLFETNSTAPGLFKSSTTAPAFGVPATPTLFGSPPTFTTTWAVPYTGTRKQDNNTYIVVKAITAMSAYTMKSFEELRMEDYIVGNKGTATAKAATFDGSSTASCTTSTFATTSRTSAPSPGLFGGTNTAAPLIGSAPSSAFGSSSGTEFGTSSLEFRSTISSAPASTTASSFGFESPPLADTGFPFGSTAPVPSTSSFGAHASSKRLFGTTLTTSITTAYFGGSSAPVSDLVGLFSFAPTTTGGGFFQTTPPAPSLFEMTPPTTTNELFGSTATSFGSSSGFGAPARTTTTYGKTNTPKPLTFTPAEEYEYNDHFYRTPSKADYCKTGWDTVRDRETKEAYYKTVWHTIRVREISVNAPHTFTPTNKVAGEYINTCTPSKKETEEDSDLFCYTCEVCAFVLFLCIPYFIFFKCSS